MPTQVNARLFGVSVQLSVGTVHSAEASVKIAFSLGRTYPDQFGVVDPENGMEVGVSVHCAYSVALPEPHEFAVGESSTVTICLAIPVVERIARVSERIKSEGGRGVIGFGFVRHCARATIGIERDGRCGRNHWRSRCDDVRWSRVHTSSEFIDCCN